MRTLRAMVVDDESPAREELCYILSELPAVEVVETASDAEEALYLISTVRPDVLFLDIRMPGLSGTQLAERLRDLAPSAHVIFVTAFPEYALEAFELDAVDYLLKPLDPRRVAAALGKAVRRRGGGQAGALLPARTGKGEAPGPGAGAARPRAPGGLGKLPVHCDGRTLLLEESAIFFARAAQGYTSIHLRDRAYLSSYSLNELQERLLSPSFFRCHRAYLVNLDHAQELIPDFKGAYEIVMKDQAQTRVPVSRRQAQQLKAVLGL